MTSRPGADLRGVDLLVTTIQSILVIVLNLTGCSFRVNRSKSTTQQFRSKSYHARFLSPTGIGCRSVPR